MGATWADIGALVINSWAAMAATALLAYLFGGINTAIIVTKACGHGDIRTCGSGNAGATNVLRTVGKVPALITLIGDLAKTVAAIYLGQMILQSFSGGDYAPDMLRLVGSYLAGLFCILGHLYPPYFQFRGGKGVVALLGLGLILDWRVALLSILVFAVVVLTTRYVSLGALLGALFAVGLTYVFRRYVDGNGEPTEAAAFCTALLGASVLLVVLKHIPNIKRLLTGKENKISFSRSK